MFKRISHTFLYVLDQDEATTAQVRELITKGGAGALRDPFGNPLRFTERPAT
jgi:hypothetical protein